MTGDWHNYHAKEFYCSKIQHEIYHVIGKSHGKSQKSFEPFLSVQFSSIKYIHIIVQPSPLSISRILHLAKLRLYTH